ncbi:MAG: HAMP domain-containing protein [Marinicaulis sp.]|nr:HAMP domain-containing protein [Marinicaulis sp.]
MKRTRFLPSWARSNKTAAIALASAAAVAFFTTWFLMSPLVERVDRTILMWMVIGNVVIAAAFAGLIGIRLWDVLSERRHQLAGSRTHLQLVVLFSALAVVPAVIAFLFAFTILRASLNDVFSERVENYQNTVRDLANGLININSESADRMIREIAFDIRRQEEAEIGLEQTPISFRRYIYAQAQVRGLSALYLLDGEMNILVAAELEPADYNFPSAERMNAMRNADVPGGQANFGVNDDTTFDVFRAALPIEEYGGGFVIAYYAIDPQTTARIFSAREVVEDWEEAVLGRSRLERTFLAGYVVLAIIILFGAIWLAIWAATRIVQPISRLVNMSERVSGGDLGARVEVFREDGELGALARSMNHMTAQLQSQRDDLIDTNRQFDNRRRFTEAVLSGVSAGVIGFDAEGRITIANKSAAELIGEDTAKFVGNRIETVMPELSSLIARAASSPFPEVGDQIEMTRHGRAQVLNVRIVKDDHDGEQNFVATFDDITQLISAQRNAAWGDVARRIAHEIKNPLTPIQLSAERLRRKYLNEVTSTPEIFDKCTDTIIRHVSDIGRMVDEFSSFARMPAPVIGVEDIREIVKTAIFPQKVAFADIVFVVETPEYPVPVECDGRLIVQALSNILKNAGESISARVADNDNGVGGQVKVVVGADASMAKIQVIDNGVGLPAAERHRLAEPYMTTRTKGTGLGLAIVKKVVEEHGGALEFADSYLLGETGACVTITLPRASAAENPVEGPVADPATAAE